MDNTSLLSNETDPVIKALRDMIRLVPETKYSKIKVDADQSLLTPIIEGPYTEGGYITTKKIVAFFDLIALFLKWLFVFIKADCIGLQMLGKKRKQFGGIHTSFRFL